MKIFFIICFFLLTSFVPSDEFKLVDRCEKLKTSYGNSDVIYKQRCNDLRGIVKRNVVSVLRKLGAEIIYKGYCEDLKNNLKKVEVILKTYCQKSNLSTHKRTKRQSNVKEIEGFVESGMDPEVEPEPEDEEAIHYHEEGKEEERNTGMDRVDLLLNDLILEILEEENIQITADTVLIDDDVERIADQVESQLSSDPVDGTLRALIGEVLLEEGIEITADTVILDENDDEDEKMVVTSKSGKIPLDVEEDDLSSHCDTLRQARKMSNDDYQQKCEQENFQSLKHKVETYFERQGATHDIKTYCNLLKQHMDKADNVMELYCSGEKPVRSKVDQMLETLITEVIEEENININTDVKITEDSDEINKIVTQLQNTLAQAPGDTLEEKLRGIVEEVLSEEQIDPGQTLKGDQGPVQKLASRKESSKGGKGSRVCGPKSRFTCTSSCPLTCEMIMEHKSSSGQQICSTDCIDECECVANHVWSGEKFKSECIPKSECNQGENLDEIVQDILKEDDIHVPDEASKMAIQEGIGEGSIPMVRSAVKKPGLTLAEVKENANAVEKQAVSKAQELRASGKTLMALFLEIANRAMVHVYQRLNKLVEINPYSVLVPFLVKKLVRAVDRVKDALVQVAEAGY